jgi:tRNA (guanine37-N1)-methyltransferase
MKFNIITIFPELISNYSAESILGRAQEKKLIFINPVNLRDFTDDKHKTVDDTPYGGGAGMVMMAPPIFEALKSLDALSSKSQDANHKMQTNSKSQKNKKTILLSPRGKQFDQRMAEELSQLQELTFVCGRYEGVDQRVSDFMVDEEISIGPYVLAGGELGALVVIEAVSRLILGVLGNEESLEQETFIANDSSSMGSDERLAIGHEPFVEYDQYTKPADFMGHVVPDVLLSGNHEEIRKWRKGV